MRWPPRDQQTVFWNSGQSGWVNQFDRFRPKKPGFLKPDETVRPVGFWVTLVNPVLETRKRFGFSKFFNKNSGWLGSRTDWPGRKKNWKPNWPGGQTGWPGARWFDRVDFEPGFQNLPTTPLLHQLSFYWTTSWPT